MIGIGILILGTELAHNFRLCDLFPEVHRGVVVVDDVECVSGFDALGIFWGAGTDAFLETSEFISIRRVLCWS